MDMHRNQDHPLPAATWTSGRAWLALIFLVIAYGAFGHVERWIEKPIWAALQVQMIANGELVPAAYAVLAATRLAGSLLMVAAVCQILGHPLLAFPLVGPRPGRMFLIGIATGLAVMSAAIVAIIASGHATVSPSGQTLPSAALHAAAWLACETLTSAGEELFGRVALLLVAERLIGWRGAIFASGAVFLYLHLGNPGANWLWLLRLFLQGALLAFAVYRTGSIWWSIGYHAGWNWVSAPLFGAAGSGYMAQGHILDFEPMGSQWFTGGAIGPEGSVLAFVAVLLAFAILLGTTPRRNL